MAPTRLFVPRIVLSTAALLAASCAQYTSAASGLISVIASPHQATVAPGRKVSFSAVVNGASGGQSGGVIWSVQEPGGGTVDGAGVYTAPAATGTFHVVATSFANPSSTDLATVLVQDAPSTISVSVTPATASAMTGGTVQFSAAVSGAAAGQSTAVTWSVQEAGGGSVSGAGLYTAPATVGTYHVVATSVADPAQSDSATVQVTATPVIAVAVSPKTAATTTGRTLAFSATVTGAGAGQSTAVTWTVQEAGGGTISAAGSYTAPAIAGTYHVVATSVADTTKTDTATVTVTAIAVAISPKTAATTTGNTLAFSATVTGTVSGQSTGVTWSVQEAGGGTISAGGSYTAPATVGTYHVVATSVADTSKTDTATVTVSATPVIAVSVSPKTAATTTGKTLAFSATVTGTVAGQSTAVTWSVQEAGGGTITAAGSYTAPATAGTYHVVATSVADTSKTDVATVTVTSIAVAIAPKTAATTTGNTLAFSATVTGTVSGQSTGVTWSVQEAGGGTVSASGSYTAPASAGTYHVIATSVADTTKKDTATVTVTAIAVAISPNTAATSPGGSVAFSATVSGTVAGQSTLVTWSVQEGATGGNIGSSGQYTAPGTAGTYHVIATSIADTSKNAVATVLVSVPVVSVSIAPQNPVLAPSSSLLFSATVLNATDTRVNWSVVEGASGGSVDTSGHYTAPATEGTYHVVATSLADSSKSATAVVTVSTLPVLTADRRTSWNPGMMAAGGIPARSTVCATVSASTYGNGGQEASAGIQAAIESCPAGQVVQLSAGTFLTNNYVIVDRPITLRGAGAGTTILKKTNGAQMNQETSPDAQPNIIIGPNRWPHPDNSTSRNLTVDGAKGSYSVTVTSASGYAAGQIVLLDELSGASWQTDRLGRGQIWASPDYRVVWQFHNPGLGFDDPLLPTTPTSGGAASWFSRQDRVTAEWKEIASVSGNTVTFTTPLHIDYRVSHTAQITRNSGGDVHLKNAGVENLTAIGGSDGSIRFEAAAYSWAKAVEVTIWAGEGFAVNNSFRVEVRDSYVHDAAWAQPGGAGYAISLADGSAEALFENNISVMANKVMVARCAGAGSVFGYNYADDGYINTVEGWIEIGLNASHMVGPHHVLFEGNYGFNWDSDHTHGNSIYHTIFRNYLRCIRKPFTDPLNGHAVDDAAQTGNGPRRCAGATGYSYWMSFIGNVLGAPGQMSGFTYDVSGAGGMDKPAIWLLGWDDTTPQPYDPATAPTTVRHGNFDYLTNTVQWDPGSSDHAVPTSLYLSAKPAFFAAGSGYTWPWVDPTGTTKVYVLPAKARYDAGTPFVQP